MKRNTNDQSTSITRRPLSVRRETVRVLSDSQLRLVPGGVGSDSVQTPVDGPSCINK